jgi:hypothetical protein
MSSDDYQRKYMSEGGIVYQSKARAPLLFHILVLSPSLISLPIVAAVASEPGASAWTWLTLLPSLAITVIVWFLFTVLRATVTKRHVHIQYGLFGPKIPLERIERCEAVTYDWKKYGGFGIRRASDGSWAYNMMGDQGRAVKLVWRDEVGDEVTTLLSSPDPEGFVAAVARASAKPSGVRVDVDPDALAEAERELEAELEAASAEPTEERGKVSP